MAQDPYAALRDVVKQLIAGKSAVEIFASSSTNITLDHMKELELIVRNEQPVTELEKNGHPSELNYNVPGQTEYRGAHLIIFSDPGLQGPNYQWFQDQWKTMPKPNTTTGTGGTSTGPPPPPPPPPGGGGGNGGPPTTTTVPPPPDTSQQPPPDTSQQPPPDQNPPSYYGQ